MAARVAADLPGHAAPWRRTHARPHSSQIDPGGLELGVLVESMQRFVAAEARLLEAAKRHRDVLGVVAIDVHHAGAQRARSAMRSGEVARPDRRGQTITGVVGDSKRLLQIAEAQGGQHRPEDLFARDAHLWFNAIEYGRLDVAAAAVPAHALAAKRQARALLAARGDVGERPACLYLVNNRAQRGLRIERVAGRHAAADAADLLQPRLP